MDLNKREALAPPELPQVSLGRRPAYRRSPLHEVYGVKIDLNVKKSDRKRSILLIYNLF